MTRTYNKTGKFSLHNGEVKCEICGRMFKSLRALSVHLKKTHGFGNDDSLYEDYYNRYLKKPDEGICPVCGKPTRQHRFRYDRCCSLSCARHLAGSAEREKKEPVKRKIERVFEHQIKHGLRLNITYKEMRDEYNMFKSAPGDLSAAPNRNKIVLFFQQDIFYEKERRLFTEDPAARRALVENRMKYLDLPMESLTDGILLQGFKKSGIYRSYSHFSPLWTKWFAEKYHLRKVADPFGGWGHHLIGFAAAGCGYVYNDLSHRTVENVRRMCDYLDLDYDIREGDAACFDIPSDCDAVFMCPPYGNTEVYECGMFGKDEYDTLMNTVLSNWRKSSAGTLGVIIREDYEYLLSDMFDHFDKFLVNGQKSHFNKAGKLNEYLYVIERL